MSPATQQLPFRTRRRAGSPNHASRVDPESSAHGVVFTRRNCRKTRCQAQPAAKTRVRRFHRNQQYSITALTDGSGSVIERYAYTAYGQVTFADASGTVQSTSASNNRYAYTGREWDQGLSLYHYRARMYDAESGRFASRDPIGYEDGACIYAYAKSSPVDLVDSLGLKAECNRIQRKINIEVQKKCGGIPLVGPIGIYGCAGFKVEIDISSEVCKDDCDCKPASCEYKKIEGRSRVGLFLSLTGGYEIPSGTGLGGFRISGYLGLKGEAWLHGSLSGKAENNPCAGKCDLQCPTICGSINGRFRAYGGGMFKAQYGRYYSWDVGIQAYLQSNVRKEFCFNPCDGNFTHSDVEWSGWSLFGEICGGACLRHQFF
jgi:RHS repeat-associated protein